MESYADEVIKDDVIVFFKDLLLLLMDTRRKTVL